jgi:quinohemoprotein amine dehydrogenase
MPRRLLVGSSRVWLVVGLLGLGSAGVCQAQRAGGGGGRGRGAGGVSGAAAADTTRGFVINDPTTRSHCSSCHVRDSLGMMPRISYERKTPEGWEMTVRRMVALNNVKLNPADARTIVRYLSDNQGLAPA